MQILKYTFLHHVKVVKNGTFLFRTGVLWDIMQSQLAAALLGVTSVSVSGAADEEEREEEEADDVDDFVDEV